MPLATWFSQECHLLRLLNGLDELLSQVIVICSCDVDYADLLVSSVVVTFDS